MTAAIETNQDGGESSSDPKQQHQKMASSTSSRYPVKIKRPTTTSDSGDPTDDCLFDAKRIFRLVEDERYLSANALYQSVRERIQQGEIDGEIFGGRRNNSGTLSGISGKKRPMPKKKKNSSRKGIEEQRRKAAMELLVENEEILNKMEDRCIMFEKAKLNINNDDDWTLAQSLFGVTTFYRHEQDGSMSIKLEGPVKDCSLFDQVAVLREFDLNHLWAPFCTASMTVAHLGKLDTVGWFLVGLPHFGLMRDSLFRAIGCDSIYEDGSLLIVATGIEDRPEDNNDNKTNSQVQDLPDLSLQSSFDFNAEEERIIDEIRNDPLLKSLDLPPVPTRMGGGRLTLRSFAGQIHLESPTAATTKLVANIDPNMKLIPQALLDFVMKRMCGVILNKMQRAAKYINDDPITNLHAIRMREDKDFYKTFLLPKFEGVCKLRGWQMPPIAAFELSDAQLEMADVFMSKQKHKSEVTAIKHYGATENNLETFLESPRGNGEASVANGPRVRTRDMHKDLDDMSDISKTTVATFNPIEHYKRYVEKTNQRKAREIQEARERAARRLQPKALDDDAIVRLNQLQNARQRQKAREPKSRGKTTNSPIGVEPDGSKSFADNTNRRWKVSLRSHSFFTKVFVLQFLMVTLFCMLYLDSAFQKFVAHRNGPYQSERGRDLATLAYMGMVSLVHAIFCYVAMIYAFGALQLGSIAGKRTRLFYSEYVHYAVVLSSATMVGFGIVKPGMDRALKWIIWNTYSVLNVVLSFLLEKIPDKGIVALQMALSGILSVIFSTKTLILESNIFGRCIVHVTKTSVGFGLRTIRRPFETYANSAIQQYEDGVDSMPWREDAFLTTRALLSHSAFFLLVLLFLFDFSAKKARKAIYIDKSRDSGTTASF